MERKYIQITLVIAIFAFMNIFPFHVLGSFSNSSASGTPNLDIEFYPKSPHNVSFLNTDTTLTIEIRNGGSEIENFRLKVKNTSDDFFMNGREGLNSPIRDKIKPGENKYYSFALVPKTIYNKQAKIEAILTDRGKTIKLDFKLGIKKPEIRIEKLERILGENGIGPISQVYLIPRYRRYWHPKRDCSGVASPGYVWLVLAENQTILVDGDNGKIIKENFKLPWKVSSKFRTGVSVWDGFGFENRSVPSVEITGDASYNRERGEIYLANRGGDIFWVSRRIFYWTSEATVSGATDEVPDTERVELWFSLENGESLLTISDYHHHTFCYKPVKEYSIQEYYHCPIPSNLPLQWTTFALVDYSNVYPDSSVPYDYLGFNKEVDPISRDLTEKGDIIKKNLTALVISILILVGPVGWERLRNE
ncbi:hypothetical protein AKJ52_02850 [candidate division MSBL1 archaeon SCGC-AAA382C18]|uniref:Uncharacterized protein n=1 Tax=candidate division MSBL1 archaeon SCGC-AAA382C18 TaxID=1698281 RepID=A0A133VHJ5_9EURY|nr:hypothetical protein AKJ52_02850 [candidate division MSBL1 archaeon SCGC-AAA382C18]